MSNFAIQPNIPNSAQVEPPVQASPIENKKEKIIALVKKILVAIILPQALLVILIVANVITLNPLGLTILASAGGVATLALTVASIAHSLFPKKST